MARKWVLLGTLAVGLLLGLLLVRARREAALPEVEIWLGRPLALITGHEWPRYKEDQQLFDVSWIDTPSLIRLHLPSGRDISLPSQGTWIEVAYKEPAESFRPHVEEDDVISYTSLLPLAESVSPQEFIGEVERIAAALGVDADPAFRSSLAPLAGPEVSADDCGEYGFWSEFEPDVSLELQGRIHEGFLSTGCFLVVDFRQVE